MCEDSRHPGLTGKGRSALYFANQGGMNDSDQCSPRSLICALRLPRFSYRRARFLIILFDNHKRSDPDVFIRF